MHCEFWQHCLAKANASRFEVYCDIRGRDWDVHFLLKYPCCSWNIQTVWQYLIQLEYPPNTHTHTLHPSSYTWINYQVEPFTRDWQACKNSLCPFNKGRSVSDNWDILEWILKGVGFFFFFSWKFAMPLESEEKRRWNSIFIPYCLAKTRQWGDLGEKQSGGHAKRGGGRWRGACTSICALRLIVIQAICPLRGRCVM